MARPASRTAESPCPQHVDLSLRPRPAQHRRQLSPLQHLAIPPPRSTEEPSISSHSSALSLRPHIALLTARATGAGWSAPESRNKVSPRICTAHMETAIYTRLPAGLRVRSALAGVPRRCYLVARVRYFVLPSWYTVCMLCNTVAVIVESDSA